MIPTMSIAQIGVGILMVLASLPLIFRIVPKNRVYGVRTPKAFASERNWYEINAFGGKVFLVCGCVMIVLGYFLQPYAPKPESPFASVFVAIPFFLLIPVLFLIRRYSRRFPDK